MSWTTRFLCRVKCDTHVTHAFSYTKIYGIGPGRAIAARGERFTVSVWQPFFLPSFGSWSFFTLLFLLQIGLFKRLVSNFRQSDCILNVILLNEYFQFSNFKFDADRTRPWLFQLDLGYFISNVYSRFICILPRHTRVRYGIQIKTKYVKIK